MPISILMPALSPTMTEGKLASWLKQEGDAVASGDVLAEIETDKATMEVEAVDEGILGKILVPAGTEGVAVNAPIAVLLQEGEDASALEGFEPEQPEVAAAAGAAAPAAPAEATPSAPAPKTAATAATPTTAAAPSASAPAPVTATKPSRAAGERVFASPLARRMATDAGLDVEQIAGTGPHGRVIKRDVEEAIATGVGKPAPAGPAEAAAEPAPAAAEKAAPMPEPTGPYREVPHTTMRKVIARRLSQSKREIPHYYLTIHCDVEAVSELRAQLNGRSPEGEGAYKLSVNDFIVKAVAMALRRCPEANSSWSDEAVRLFETIDVCVAVATPNGLITPIVRNADQKGLATIANEVKALAAKARDGKLMPEDYQGGGFTVSNLGMFGISEFAAVINPPQSCILACGAAEQRPVVKDGALAIGRMMTMTLSADHRIVDGAVGAEFLRVLKGLIEDPLTLLL